VGDLGDDFCMQLSALRLEVGRGGAAGSHSHRRVGEERSSLEENTAVEMLVGERTHDEKEE
jgi:hypothetical protein